MCCVTCAVSWATLVLFADDLGWCVVSRVLCPQPRGCCSPVCTLGLWCCECGVLGHLAPVKRCARLACCVAFAACWGTCLPVTGVLARCFVLPLPHPGQLCSCSPLFTLGVLCCMCGVLGHLAPVYCCACSGCFVACAVSRPLASRSPVCTLGVFCSLRAVSRVTWLLFAVVYARRVVLRVRCPGSLGSSSAVRTLGVLCCVCGVVGHLAPV